jgi:16S rRNA (guanine(527)-N(7))-methyltransferase RsmG
LKGGDLDSEIRRRAQACGLALDDRALAALAAHAQQVLQQNASLKLTTIVEPAAFVERHIGESLEGAAMLPEGITDNLLDLGSGNGYPGVPVAIAHPGLTPFLAEARRRKAIFLRELLAQLSIQGEVLDRRIDRPADVGESIFSVIVTRAAGDWERSLPRLACCLETGGRLLVWAGKELEKVCTRHSWKRYLLEERRPLPGRDASWIWLFRPKT